MTRLIRNRPPVLYDMERGEAENVAAEHPEVVERLTERLREIRDGPRDE